MGVMKLFLSPSPYFAETAVENTDIGRGLNDGDPHLRSTAAVTGYHIHASDRLIGHVENLLIDDVTWGIRYLIIDTKNWWPGKHVLMSPVCGTRDQLVETPGPARRFPRAGQIESAMEPLGSDRPGI